MPVKKQYGPLLTIFAIWIGIAAYGNGQAGNDVLDYYWRKAAETFERRRNADDALRYRLETRSFYKSLDRKGQVARVDTAKVAYFFSGPILDSAVFDRGDPARFELVELMPPDIFALSYMKNLFPNDDGVGELAIGLDTEDEAAEVPSGLLLLDRRSYLPRLLYLYYEPEGDLVRLTRSFRFFEFNGLIVPDSAWVSASKRGVFFMEHFRIETAVTDISILP